MKALIVVLLFLFSSGCFAQTGTYERIQEDEHYYSHAVLSDGSIVLQNLNLTLFDEYGVLIKSIPTEVELGEDYKDREHIWSGNNSTFYLLANDSTIVKFNNNLERLKKYELPAGVTITMLTDPNGGLYLIRGKSSGYDKFNIVIDIYDSTGAFKKSKTLLTEQASYLINTRKFIINQSSEGNLLIACYGKYWIYLDSDLNEIKSEYNVDVWDLSFTTQNNFYIRVNNYFELLDKFGDQTGIIQPQLNGSNITCSDYDDGKIAFYTVLDDDFSIGISDLNGNITYSDGCKMPYNTMAFKNYIYLFISEWNYYAICKTDKQGNYNYFQLHETDDYIPPGATTWLKWDTNLKDKNVDLYLIDSLGVKYSIASDVKVDIDSLEWETPLSDFPGSTIYAEVNDEGVWKSIVPLELIVYSANDYIDANNLTMWVSNTCQDARRIGNISSSNGLFWKGDRGLPLVYLDAPFIGYKKNGEIGIQGSFYFDGMSPGTIYSDDSTSDKGSKKFGIYKYRKDWVELKDSKQKHKSRYAKNHWPVYRGAPWKDNNYNGIYEPEIDEPDLPGKQILFWTSHANDSNYYNYSIPTEKIEFACTVFDIDKPEFENVIFKKYLIMNKTDSVLDSVYFSYYSWPEIGDYDDIAGCDSSLNLAFGYNGDNFDEYYYLDKPPAIGYQLVRGPVIESIGDTAIYENDILLDYKNLPLNAFSFFIKNSEEFQFPHFQDQYEMLYNLMKGLLMYGTPIVDPVTGKITKFPLGGDPVAGTGWYDGELEHYGFTPYFREIIISTGPFTMAPGDTNEVVIAVLAAQGNDRLDSVKKLKELASTIPQYYNSTKLFDDRGKTVLPPANYTLYQNYPNPFNPTTTIQFDLPEGGDAVLEIFDILGRRISRIEKRGLNYGTHYFTFNASGLASGIYFYRLEAGSFTDIKKMVLLK